MSTYNDLLLIQHYIASKCPLYEVNYIGPFFWAVDFFPVLLTVGFLAISLFISDLYLFVFSIFLTIDVLINLALRSIFQIEGRYPGCAVSYQMPSLASDHILFFVISVLGFITLWKQGTSIIKIVLLDLFLIVALVSRIYIGANTREQLMYGALEGLISAIFFQLMVYYILYPNIESISNHWLIKNSGFENMLLYIPLKKIKKEKKEKK
jgi:hypothetical protein